MQDKSLKVAAIQMVSGSEISVNAIAAESLVRDAVQKSGARFVVLPENFLCFNAKQYFELADQAAEYINQFGKLARELGVHIVLGSIPLSKRPDGSTIDKKMRSASIHISDQGKICARYDKVHLFDVDVTDGHGTYRESNEFEPGSTSVVTQVGSFNVGLSICYDIRFPGLYQELRRAGADVLLVPAAFTAVTGKAHWETLLRARAIENQCYVIAANQGGLHTEKRATWGQSMVIDPWGEIVASLDKGEGYCAAELRLDKLQEIRQNMPILEHNRF